MKTACWFDFSYSFSAQNKIIIYKTIRCSNYGVYKQQVAYKTRDVVENTTSIDIIIAVILLVSLGENTGARHVDFSKTKHLNFYLLTFAPLAKTHHIKPYHYSEV